MPMVPSLLPQHGRPGKAGRLGMGSKEGKGLGSNPFSAGGKTPDVLQDQALVFSLGDSCFG